MQLTSSPRRALGLLAASTVGLSTALLGITSVAQAVPAGPNTPLVIDTPAAGDGTVTMWFNPNDATDENALTADLWEYSLTSTGGAGTTDGFEPLADVVEESATFAHFELDGLTNGKEYSLSVRGVSEVYDEDTETEYRVEGAGTAPVTFTPSKPIGAPGVPTVAVGPSSLKVSWTAPTSPGTYDLVGYAVKIPISHGEMGGPETICSTSATTTSCTFGVKAGVAYPVWVHAVDTQDRESAMIDAVVSAVVPAPTVPAAVPTKTGDLKLAPGSGGAITPGKKITVSGEGYAPNSSVSVVVYSSPQVLTTIVAGPDGKFSVEVTVPADLAAGDHTLVASGVDSNGVLHYVTLPITVTKAGVATLANTGADVTVPALGGIATLGLGAGLIALSRRRRTAA